MCTPSGSQSRLLPSGRGWGGGAAPGTRVFPTGIGAGGVLARRGQAGLGQAQALPSTRRPPQAGAHHPHLSPVPPCRASPPAGWPSGKVAFPVATGQVARAPQVSSAGQLRSHDTGQAPGLVSDDRAVWTGNQQTLPTQTPLCPLFIAPDEASPGRGGAARRQHLLRVVFVLILT